jgi:hypothetical protein
MFTGIKNKIAHYIIRKKILQDSGEHKYFNNFIQNSGKIFVIMPFEESNFNASLAVLKFLLDKGKNTTLFISGEKLNLIPDKKKFEILTYVPAQRTRLNLPGKELMKKLGKSAYDIVIDLNCMQSVFSCAVACAVNSDFRIGFLNSKYEQYYNFLVPNGKNKSEISYRNLLNSLQMF